MYITTDINFRNSDCYKIFLSPESLPLTREPLYLRVKYKEEEFR